MKWGVHSTICEQKGIITFSYYQPKEKSANKLKIDLMNIKIVSDERVALMELNYYHF